MEEHTGNEILHFFERSAVRAGKHDAVDHKFYIGIGENTEFQHLQHKTASFFCDNGTFNLVIHAEAVVPFGSAK